MHRPWLCNSYKCWNTCDTIEEMVIGLCSYHINCLREETHFAGVCWNCGNITIVEPKEQEKDLIIKDKFIFSKGCRRCTGNEENNLEWMTIPKEQLINKQLSHIKVSGIKSNGSYLIN